MTQPISEKKLVWFEVSVASCQILSVFQLSAPVFLRWEGHKPIRINHPGIWVYWMNPFKSEHAHDTAHFRKEASIV
jgi:hypothetical protein